MTIGEVKAFRNVTGDVIRSGKVPAQFGGKKEKKGFRINWFSCTLHEAEGSKQGIHFEIMLCMRIR
jgi:hypothetical protein